MNPANFIQLLPLLCRWQVRFVLIGGGAAIVHGLARTTYDVDVVYDRAPDNLEKLAFALQELSAYPRGAPPGLPFHFDLRTLQSGLNFTLTTTLGDLDLLAEVPGNGTWQTLQEHSAAIQIYGCDVPVVSLCKLIELKVAAGRPKDFEVVAQLRALLAEQTGEAD